MKSVAVEDQSAPREQDKYIVRFHDPGLRKQLKVRAALNERTMNAEIIYLVKKGITAEATQQQLEGDQQ